MHLVTATVVRLVRTLAHGYFSEGFEGCPLHTASVLVVQPAPPVRAAARWRIVDMRHPSTGSDRPTVRGGRSGGQTHEAAPAGLPVDDILLHASTGCYVRDLRGPSRPRSDQGPARHVIRVTDRSKRSLTCGNAGRITSRCGRGGLIPRIGPGSSQLVDNSVEASPVTSVAPSLRGRIQSSTRARRHGGSEGGPGGRPAGRSRDGVAADRRGPPAQPAGLAATERPGDAAREHGDHRRAQRLHPQPARGPAAQPHRGRADRGLRSRDPDARDGQPGARGRGAAADR